MRLQSRAVEDGEQLPVSTPVDCHLDDRRGIE
jgi:hypothetical protein